MSGVMVGGWEYVWAAYGLTAAILVGYVLSIVLRHGAEKRRAARQAERAGGRDS